MGESTHLHHYDIDDDLRLFPYLTSINIACGAHAGDAQTMQRLVEEALKRDIAIGAHPGYADRDNFGRSAQHLSTEELQQLVTGQVEALQQILTGMGKRLHHVKAHGALYNSAAKDPELADAVCRSVSFAGRDIRLYGLSGSCMKKAAEDNGLVFVSEVFADRTYQDNGMLTPRNTSGALVEDPELCAKQLISMALHAKVTTVSGNCISLKTETICLHSDGAHALEFAILINDTLKKHGVAVSRPS